MESSSTWGCKTLLTVGLEHLRRESDGEGEVLGDDGAEALLSQSAVAKLPPAHRRTTATEGHTALYVDHSFSRF